MTDMHALLYPYMHENAKFMSEYVVLVSLVSTPPFSQLGWQLIL